LPAENAVITTETLPEIRNIILKGKKKANKCCGHFEMFWVKYFQN